MKRIGGMHFELLCLDNFLSFPNSFVPNIYLFVFLLRYLISIELFSFSSVIDARYFNPKCLLVPISVHCVRYTFVFTYDHQTMNVFRLLLLILLSSLSSKSDNSLHVPIASILLVLIPLFLPKLLGTYCLSSKWLSTRKNN